MRISLIFDFLLQNTEKKYSALHNQRLGQVSKDKELFILLSFLLFDPLNDSFQVVSQRAILHVGRLDESMCRNFLPLPLLAYVVRQG